MTDTATPWNPVPEPAVHDAESGAMSRELLLTVLSPILALTRRNSRALASLHVRVDALADRDGLARDVVEVIDRCVRGEDLVARLDRCTFAVVLLEVWEADAAVRVAQRLARELGGLTGVREPGVSIGVAFFPHDGTDGSSLLAAAAGAAPATGAIGFANPELGATALRRAGLVAELTGARAVSQFALHYQPILSVGGGEVVGAEALLRWDRMGSLLPAADFIGAAEASGRIRAIDRWSIERAFLETRSWREAGWDGWIALNLSGRSLTDPTLPDTIASLMEATDTPADAVMFEITERSAIAGSRETRALLEELRALGTRIAVDDFGAGYASFEYLCEFDPDIVKLDRAFVAEGLSPEPLMPALVELAHHLGKPVVIEGVENRFEWDRVVATGSDLVQGYFMGRPVASPGFMRRHIEERAVA